MEHRLTLPPVRTIARVTSVWTRRRGGLTRALSQCCAPWHDVARRPAAVRGAGLVQHGPRVGTPNLELPTPLHCPRPRAPLSGLFFFNDTATTEIYTLSLHDALPI